MPQPHPARSASLFLALALVLVVPALIGVGGWRLLSAQQAAEAAKADLKSARAALSAVAHSSPAPIAAAPAAGGGAAPAEGGSLSAATGAQIAASCAATTRAHIALREVHEQVGVVLPLVGALERVPVVGSEAKSQASALAAGTHLASAGHSLCEALGPLAPLLDRQSGQGTANLSAAETLRGLVAARPRLLQAAEELRRLDASLNERSASSLDPESRDMAVALKEKLPAMVERLEESALLLGLLDGERPRRYLLLSQNPDELRPTGGFIGTAGLVEINQGDIRLVEYGTSLAYLTPASMRVTPPDWLEGYLGPYWHLAAANWWAHFPRVAQQIEYLYRLARPDQSVDGVIALDQMGMALLLQALGPVHLPDYGETVSAQNLQALLDQYVHDYDGSGEVERKAFAAALSRAVLQKALSARGSSLLDAATAVGDALDQQHLLIWANEPETAHLLAAKRWDGGLLPSDGDSLLVADSEVSPGKHSQDVRRTIRYHVDLSSSAAPRAELRITYANEARPSDRPGVRFFPEYRTLMRAYVPAGATLTDSVGFSGPISTQHECDRTVFSGEVHVRAGEQTHVALHYTLPPAVLQTGHYRLLLQQQPGVPPGLVSVSAGAAGESAASVELPNQPGGHASWQLDADQRRLSRLPLPEPRAGVCADPIVQGVAVSPPAALQIPRIGLSAPVVELGVGPDGVLEAPERPDQVGWYRMSARGGQPGNSVMSGHVDWGQDTAVFWGLRELVAGDRIEVRSADGSVHAYAVEWNESFETARAPLQKILGGSDETVLTLITCDGVYDKQERDYSHRRVVRAKLVE